MRYSDLEIINAIQEEFDEDDNFHDLIDSYIDKVFKEKGEIYWEFDTLFIKEGIEHLRIDFYIMDDDDDYHDGNYQFYGEYGDLLGTLNTPVIYIYVAYKEGILKTEEDLRMLENGGKYPYNLNVAIEKANKFVTPGICLNIWKDFYRNIF
jgi:hypothetical protein